MSFCQSYLSRRIPVLSKSYRCSVQTQLQARLARNISTSSTSLQRPNLKRHALKCARQRYLSTDQPSTGPPVSSNAPGILLESPSQTQRNDEEFPTPPSPPTTVSLHADALPVSCPGCGAYAQTIEPTEPGYYGRTRKKAKKLWHKRQQVIAKDKQTELTRDEKDVDGETGAGEELSEHTMDNLVDESNLTAATEYIQSTAEHTQICDRCHDLLHHNKGISAPSPSIDSIAAYLEESPHKSNRVYHIVDAADFPMSLISNIYEALELQDPRSKNRRARTEKYKHGKKLTTMSFVITRADLLAATKEQVDSLMNRVREIILKAMKMRRGDIRLGNVHMISAHRGWWTTRVKEEIREHGGGIWVVGKANVGKSSFIESCFPKDSKNLEKIAELLESRKLQNHSKSTPDSDFDSSSPPLLDPEGLLPPAPREELWPTLPVVSSLPGTTVGPIRIPFGRGRGEVIDLPGLDRGTLQEFMLDEHKSELIMTKRVNPAEQLSIRSSQSLLIGGGLIRITPIVPENCTVLAACFVPLEAHVTRTEKAVEIETGVRKYNTGGGDRGNSVIKPELLDDHTVIQHAGTFTLDTDVTLSHLPSIIKKKWDDQNIKPNLNSLPYRVYSTDILIEGCGWIELTAQIRTKRQYQHRQTPDSEIPPYEEEGEGKTEEEGLPKVEVFTPLGKHVASRPPLETWNFIRDKRKADKRKGRYMSGSHRPKRNNISHKKRTMHGGKGA
ncbi:hypothetical protein UA08_03784 [Talaromyces atroroseus]|uniref:G domain-containing protein n=1 Tax=Talaromyces atroroseus TaxID=1441469 RepID=A0A225B2H1_TALAT|nr:hypothetical protein UA08_03784 [Talaromyces atroroseus]OKL61025.1 hypothetical protein UA08_03784 [Talaromyces atroroseus]